MAVQQQLRERATLLADLRQIVQAMKNLALAELQRLQHSQPALAEAQRTLEAAWGQLAAPPAVAGGAAALLVTELLGRAVDFAARLHLVLTAAALGSVACALASAQEVSPDLLLKPTPDSWPTYHGDYSGQRHSSLKQITPATAPITSAPTGLTKPDAGVMATRPATAPDTMPSTLGLPRAIHSANIQPIAAAAVATWVTAIAMPALTLAPPAEPALKPNQPTHSSEAPITL